MTFPANNIPAPDNSLIYRLIQATKQRWRRSIDPSLPQTDLPAPHDLAPSVPPPVDNRSHPRIPVKATSVQVTDGCLCATAKIDNISPLGICLRNLPEPLYRDAKSLTVFSSDNPGLPILHIKPRWERTDWEGKTIGAVIINAPEAWQLFFSRIASQIAM